MTRSPLDLLLPWANGGQGMGFNETDDSGATSALKQEVLNQMKLYDPNARLDEAGQPTFDSSKLPQFKGGNPAQFGGVSNLINFAENDAGSRVKDPQHVIHDENYGDWTYRGNVTQAEGDKASGFMGALETYMPMAIGSVMAMATGGMLSPSLINMAAGLANGEGVDMTSIFQKIVSTIANQYVPGAGTAINLAAGAARGG